MSQDFPSRLALLVTSVTRSKEGWSTRIFPSQNREIGIVTTISHDYLVISQESGESFEIKVSQLTFSEENACTRIDPTTEDLIQAIIELEA